MDMTDYQKKFCEAYVRTGSPSKAYREAYPANSRIYTAKAVHANAVKLLKKKKIKDYIEALGDAPKLVDKPKHNVVGECCHCHTEAADLDVFKENADKIMRDALAVGDLHTALDANRFLCELELIYKNRA